MVSFGNSYVQSGPVKSGRDLVWKIMSAEDECKSYQVSIVPMILISRKKKRKMYKNFIYKCECLSNKLGFLSRINLRKLNGGVKKIRWVGFYMTTIISA